MEDNFTDTNLFDKQFEPEWRYQCAHHFCVENMLWKCVVYNPIFQFYNLLLLTYSINQPNHHGKVLATSIPLSWKRSFADLDSQFEDIVPLSLPKIIQPKPYHVILEASSIMILAFWISFTQTYSIHTSSSLIINPIDLKISYAYYFTSETSPEHIYIVLKDFLRVFQD